MCLQGLEGAQVLTLELVSRGCEEIAKLMALDLFQATQSVDSSIQV